MPRFPHGTTVVRRDIFGGKVWTATPYRTVRDDGETVALAHWPGVESLKPTTWIRWLRQGDEGARAEAFPNLAAGTWELDGWTWQDTTTLTLAWENEYFAVDLVFRDGTFTGWYVNFQRPFVRTTIGVDTFDLLLDLVVDADGAARWKDEGEYAHGRRLGLVSDAEHRAVGLTREQVLSLLAGRTGPFAYDWTAWRRDARWPDPVLPATALSAEGAEPASALGAEGVSGG
jgi:protein associated with RNAse G/E